MDTTKILSRQNVMKSIPIGIAIVLIGAACAYGQLAERVDANQIRSVKNEEGRLKIETILTRLEEILRRLDKIETSIDRGQGIK